MVFSPITPGFTRDVIHTHSLVQTWPDRVRCSRKTKLKILGSGCLEADSH